MYYYAATLAMEKPVANDINEEKYQDNINLIHDNIDHIAIKSWSYIYYNQNLINGKLRSISDRSDPLSSKELSNAK